MSMDELRFSVRQLEDGRVVVIVERGYEGIEHRYAGDAGIIHMVVGDLDPRRSYWTNFSEFWRRAWEDFVMNAKLAWPVFVALFLFPFASAGFLMLGEGDQKWNFGKALYVTWITMTTVGYGDFTPMSFWGRSLASLDAFGGIILVGVIVWIVTASLSRR